MSKPRPILWPWLPWLLAFSGVEMLHSAGVYEIEWDNIDNIWIINIMDKIWIIHG